MSESQWRQRAAIIIAQALSSLPANATPKEKRNAIRAAYPFGQRRFHPYKMWLKEVRLALAPEIEKQKGIPVISVWAGGIICGWCDGRRCLACLGARTDFEFVMQRREWLGFWSQIDAGNQSARTALADWLKDQDLEELAKLI